MSVGCSPGVTRRVRLTMTCALTSLSVWGAAKSQAHNIHIRRI